MNILITGASRGIGAATLALLEATGHRPLGHSTMGSDTLIAGDLADPEAPRGIWETALNELGGRIVNVVSRAAFRGDSPQHWHYSASKAGMVGMTRTIARGYAGDNILCFGVAPGFTVSEMTEEYLAGRGGSKIIADIPLGRVASTDEIAEIIRWLSVDAPPSATGTIIDANGASYVR